MAQDKIINITPRFRLHAGNSLEEYRCQSFFTKEPETVAWIEQMMQDGEVLLDVGANIGIYAIYAALLYPRSRVYAVEPFEKNYHRLCANRRLNQLDNLVALHLGFSDLNAIEPLFVKDERLGASGSQLHQNLDEHGRPYEVLWREFVPTMSIDSFLEVFACPVPNHIKIDVDGIEARIVAGMQDTLRNESLRSVLIEINKDSSDVEALLKTFREAGFRNDHPLNSMPGHSRERRRGTPSESAENIIFTRQ